MPELTENSVAFKEWACVVRALATGEQILILRKGVIHEKGKKFDVAHESFFLFPTYEHQNPEDLSPRGRALLQETLSAYSRMKKNDLPIETFANVEENFWIDRLEKLLLLSPFHVWSELAVRKRFEWGKEKGLYVMVCRVFKLPQANLLKNNPAYGGCRSWVDLDTPIARAGIRPVLTDPDFQEKFASLRRLLA